MYKGVVNKIRPSVRGAEGEYRRRIVSWLRTAVRFIPAQYYASYSDTIAAVDRAALQVAMQINAELYRARLPGEYRCERERRIERGGPNGRRRDGVEESDAAREEDERRDREGKAAGQGIRTSAPERVNVGLKKEEENAGRRPWKRG